MGHKTKKAVKPKTKTMDAQHIYCVISSGKFARWFELGRFASHIQGDLPEVTMAEIEQDIERFFLF